VKPVDRRAAGSHGREPFTREAHGQGQPMPLMLRHRQTSTPPDQRSGACSCPPRRFQPRIVSSGATLTARPA
jgi:hypothetical protein